MPIDLHQRLSEFSYGCGVTREAEELGSRRKLAEGHAPHLFAVRGLVADPEWGRAFWTGTVAAACDHARMLKAVKVPVLFTHHFRHTHEETGVVMGAISDLQAGQVRRLIEAAGQPFDYRSFPQMGHAMHAQDPALWAETVAGWAEGVVG